MTDFEFYQLTKETLEGAASKRGITPSELRKYYSHTDAHCNFYQSLTEIPQVFAQMAFRSLTGIKLFCLRTINP